MSWSASDSTETFDSDDHAQVEHLLAKLEEMVSICSHLVDSLAGNSVAFDDGPLPDPFYSSTFD